MKFMRAHWDWLLIGAVAVLSMALVFSVNGIYDTRIDGPAYAGQISSFASGAAFSADPAVMIRLFKPLYAIIGGSLLHSTHPYAVIFGLNIIFYLLLAISARALLSLLGFSKQMSLAGTLWIITAYPLLKYGLALGTDISGWFFATATLAVGLYALKKDSLFILCLASFLGFLGATAKETGPLGLIALCVLIAWRFRRKGFKAIAVRCLAAGLPALILYAVLIAVIAGQAPSFLDWFSQNKATYGAQYHTLFKWAAIEASAFGLLWIAAARGLISRIRARACENADFLVIAFCATLPVLAWPLFISRIMFIQFLWVIPLALYGLSSFQSYAAAHMPNRAKALTACMIAAPIVFNALLFLAGARGSLFSFIGG